MNTGTQEAAERTRLIAAIDSLPMAERAVYLLAAMDGLDYLRIGFRLGIPIDEVARLAASALVAVCRALDRGDEHQKP